MYDSNAKSSSRAYLDHYDRAEPEEPVIRPSEADLLRALGRALGEQRLHERARDERTRDERTRPLVDRIETILGSRLQAANDVSFAREPEWTIDEPLDWDDASPEPAVEAVTIDVPNEQAPAQTASSRGWRKGVAIVALAAAAGMALPALMPSSPTRYAATTVLAVKADDASRAAAMQTATRKLMSSPFVASAVAKLKLDHDPEFAGSNTNSVSVALDLLTASGAAADPVSRAETTLKSAMALSQDLTAGTLSLKVIGADSAKSVRIANYLAAAMSDASDTPKAKDGADALRKDYDDAQSALAAFTAKSGDGNVKVAIDLQRQIDQLDADLKIADQRTLLAKDEADRLKSAKLADITNGTLPPELLSQALQDWRDKFAAAKVSLAQLSANLGPRHPRLLQLQAEADGLKDNISKELLRLAQDADATVKSAASARKGLNDRRNALIAQSRDTGVDLARLTELREKANLARSRLDDAGASVDTSQDGGITVLKPAEVSKIAAGSTFIKRSLLGGAIGFALGLGVVFLRRRSRRPDEVVEAEVSLVEPPALQFNDVSELQLLPELPALPEPDPEMEELRLKIADLRDRLRHYATERPSVFR